MADTKDLPIIQGKTFPLVLRWETEPIIYKAITAIQQSAPARLTVTGHGFPDGWRCAITNVKGMTEINAEANNLRDKDYNPITVVDANTVEINKINAAGFKAHVANSGILQGNTPVDLTGYTARLSICDRTAKWSESTAHIWNASTDYEVGAYVVLANGSTVLVCTTAGTSGGTRPTAAGSDGTVIWMVSGDFVGPKELTRFVSPTDIVLNTALHTITLTISATDTAAFAWKKGVYDLELVSASGVVTALLTGSVTVTKEVTT
jgi:hypothetical protein